MARNESAADLLVSAGLKPTRTREAVLSALAKAGSSLSHGDLVDLLPGLDRVTVFRSLKTLKTAGLLHSVSGPDGVLRFVAHGAAQEACPGGHPHFLCLRCGTMTCLEDQVLPHVEVPRGAEVRGKQFVVYGLCADCSRKAASRRGSGSSTTDGKVEVIHK